MSDKVSIRKSSKEELEKLGVFDWPIWEKEVSEFDWYYDEPETFYVIEGEVEVSIEGDGTVRFGAGDLVTFKSGTKCTWRVLKPIKKHYHFGEV